MDSTISPAAIRKVTRELYSIHDDPPEGIRVILNEDSIDDIQAWILGPEGTPYAGGCFRVRIQLVPDFPNSPPKCYFLTKIFHPNVSAQGDVCVSTLKKDWRKELGIKHILLVVKCLLIVPNPESALNEEAGRQLLERYDDYARHARLMTDIHARAHQKEIFPITQASSSGSPVHFEGVSDKAVAAYVTATTETFPARDGLGEKKRQMGLGEGETAHPQAGTKPPLSSFSSAPPITSPQPSSTPTVFSSTSSITFSAPGCSSTLTLLNNGCPPCSPRTSRKRKLSTDEQHQHSSGTAIASTAFHKAPDASSTTTMTATASLNHTHTPISHHSSSKLSLQESKTNSRNQQPLPGHFQTGFDSNRGFRGSTLQGDWPTTTLTGLTAPRPLAPSLFVVTPFDQDKKRSLRRL